MCPQQKHAVCFPVLFPVILVLFFTILVNYYQWKFKIPKQFSNITSLVSCMLWCIISCIVSWHLYQHMYRFLRKCIVAALMPKSVMFHWFALAIEPCKQMVSATLSDRETTLIQYRRNPATCRLLELSFCFVQFLRCRSSTIIAQSKFNCLIDWCRNSTSWIGCFIVWCTCYSYRQGGISWVLGKL